MRCSLTRTLAASRSDSSRGESSQFEREEAVARPFGGRLRSSPPSPPPPPPHDASGAPRLRVQLEHDALRVGAVVRDARAHLRVGHLVQVEARRVAPRRPAERVHAASNTSGFEHTYSVLCCADALALRHVHVHS